jgi:hypothetical protein
MHRTGSTYSDRRTLLAPNKVSFILATTPLGFGPLSNLTLFYATPLAAEIRYQMNYSVPIKLYTHSHGMRDTAVRIRSTKI